MFPPALHADSGAHTRCVLVVEDQVLVRNAIADFLRDQHYRVIEASNAAEALAVFESDLPIDVMFTDREMPGEMDGWMLAQWVHQHHPRVRVLLTSGKALNAPLIAGWVFFSKPYSFGQVAECIGGFWNDAQT